ncbi:MAG TPA: glycoside hydrolase family 3 N-terminal domain-containing protein [Candidatus Dormibacteraeota bacterium]|nr:glycoside hydrolase family 3 N-terminal domain-containing protein [Candidatus Dormibacteraeota bacterium]
MVVALLAVLVVLGRPMPSARLAVAITSPSPIPPSPTPAWDLDADIGAVMVFSWRGAVPNESVMPVLAHDQVGGVLLFTANFGGYSPDLKYLSDRLQRLASSECSAHPILVMLDQEGGEVSNVKDLAPPWPRDMALGGPDNVRSVERASGAGLAAAGVGLNLAPVADVRTNPRDAVIGDRSFGSSTAVVAPSVAAAVEGLHEGGVGATVKHFPGLGGAAGDPHVAIPTDPESEATWRAVQEPAFKSGIDAGADAVMVTAVYTPGLGSGSTPALFSSAIISRLRGELGFTGVIVSDSLSMWGIGQRWSLGEAAVMALAAGNDMLLLGNGDPSLESAAVAAVKAAVLSGRLDRTRLHESALRVNALRDRWGRPPTPCVRPVTP